MTARRFGRLTLVLILPLLLAGWVFAHFVAPYGGGKNIVCTQFLGIENCRNLGWEGNFYESVKRESPAWFEIRLGAEQEQAAQFYNFEGAQRLLVNAVIVGASPYAGAPPEAASLMEALVGKTANVQLGIEGGLRSFQSGEQVFLYCNSLEFNETPGMYQSGCYGDGWAGPVDFALAGESQAQLEQLRASMREEITFWDNDLLLYKIVTYPLFVYLFFIGSGLVWLIRAAVRYVKAG